jgi:predicted RecA/RadA family phage recombinase
MTALAADRQTVTTHKERIISLPLASGASIFTGGMVALNAAGSCVAASDTAALVIVGRAAAPALYSAGDRYVEVERGVFWYANGSNAVEAADRGQICYVEDDQTVGDRAGTNGVIAGTVEDVDTTLGVLVNMTGQYIPAGRGAVQALTGAGAALPDVELTTLAVSGAIAITLADGHYAGQRKYFRCISASNTATLTPATPSGFATIAFDAAGEYACLMWTGAAWIILHSAGATPA